MAVDAARAGVADGAESGESLAKLETELRRVQGWAASFGMRELKRQSGQLAARVRRWVDDPNFERTERAAIMAAGAERLTGLAAEQSVRMPPGLTPRPAPVPEPQPPAPPPPPVGGPTVVRASLADAPDVVVVQDDPRMTRLLLFALEQAGLRVTTFDSGPVALDALRRMPASPGRPLVLLDVELPGLDGHDVHETLRAERPGMFSFVFTAGPQSDGERMRALNAGALDYVMRPISLSMLTTKIPRWLALGVARPGSPADRRPPVIIGRRRSGAA